MRFGYKGDKKAGELGRTTPSPTKMLNNRRLTASSVECVAVRRAGYYMYGNLTGVTWLKGLLGFSAYACMFSIWTTPQVFSTNDHMISDFFLSLRVKI